MFFCTYFTAQWFHQDFQPLSVSCIDERERYFYTGSQGTCQKCHESHGVTELYLVLFYLCLFSVDSLQGKRSIFFFRHSNCTLLEFRWRRNGIDSIRFEVWEFLRFLRWRKYCVHSKTFHCVLLAWMERFLNIGIVTLAKSVNLINFLE